MKKTTEVDDIHFVRVKAVMEMTGIAKSTIYAWIIKGHFPKPVAIGPNVSGFRLKDIREWAEDPTKWRAENEIKNKTA